MSMCLSAGRYLRAQGKARGTGQIFTNAHEVPHQALIPIIVRGSRDYYPLFTQEGPGTQGGYIHSFNRYLFRTYSVPKYESNIKSQSC